MWLLLVAFDLTLGEVYMTESRYFPFLSLTQKHNIYILLLLLGRRCPVVVNFV